MNSQGYTKDNIHKGNTKIVAGGIDVDGLIRIGDQSAGGDGYVLPETKGTIGQVITMNADNTTSFQDTSSGVSGRFVKNLYTMIDRNASFSITPQDVYSTGYGSLDLGSIDNFPVGATIHLYTKGTWQTSGGGILGSFAFIINDGDPTTLTISAPVLSMSNNNQRMFYNDLILQRTGTNEYKFKGTGITGSGGSGTPTECIFWPASTITPATPFTNFDLRFAWVTNANTFYPLTTTFIVDMILDSSLLVATPPAPTSHTALTDLTAGDAGHTQFAQLNGRSGGQTLSGGITNLHNLTLKSHDIGLPNVIVRDLNTTFEKNIDMNQNQIDNVLVVNNQTGPLNLIGGSGVSAVLIDATPTQGIIIGSNVGASTEITGDTELSLISNTGNIECNPFNQFNVNASGLPRLSVDASEVALGNPLNVNNNNINNVLNINSGTNINLNPTGLVDCNGDIDMGGNRINGVPEIVGDGTNMTIRNGGGISILLDQATNKVALLNNNLDMNNNNIDNVNNVISSGTLNLESSGGSQSIQLDGTFITFFQGGGSFVPTFTASAFDMNNGGINNVSSINGLTPVGGLSSSTSNSAILTASTAEQSILGLTFVGGRMASANSFKQGDAYTATLAGNFSSNNGDTLTLRLKGGATGTTVLSSIVVPLNSSTNKYFELEINFVIRQIGVATTADLAINYDFSYNQNSGGNFQGERLCESNNTNFDTTIDNQLDITAQFSSTSANNSIETILATLGKNY